MSGEGLEVRRTKCPATLKRISRTLPYGGIIAFPVHVLPRRTCTSLPLTTYLPVPFGLLQSPTYLTKYGEMPVVREF